MLNAFKSIKSIILGDENKNKEKIMKKLFLSKDKKNFIELQFLNGFIVNDILKLYGSEIFDKLENNKDYKFLLIDDKNIEIQIILKPHEKIFEHLLNENINIYYLPIKKNKQNEEDEINNLINDEINFNSNLNSKKNILEENLIYKEKIIKISRKKRKSIEVKAKLFSNYLQLYDKKTKKTNIIIISNIEKIHKNELISYKPNKKNIILEIELKLENKKKKSYFLCLENNKEYLKWFNLISTQYNCYLDKNNMNNNIKNINNLNQEKSLLLKNLINFIENNKNLKDLIKNKFIRNFILNNIIQKNLSVIFNDIFLYKNNIKLLKFNDAWLNLIELIEYFGQKKEFINFDDDYLNKLNEIKNNCKEIMFKNEKNNNNNENNLINDKLNKLLNINLFDDVLDNLINNYLIDEFICNSKINHINNAIIDLYPCEKNFYVDIKNNLNDYLIPE